MKRMMTPGACIAICLLGSGCGPSGLTRDRAKELIQAYLDSRPGLLEIDVPRDLGVSEGWWSLGSQVGASRELIFSAEGDRLFSHPHRVLAGPGKIRVTTKLAHFEVLEVTRIDEGTPTEKEAHYTRSWNTDKLPEKLRRLVVTPLRQRGVAVDIQTDWCDFRLTDDGWRIVQPW
jgi:hypothetical protein